MPAVGEKCRWCHVPNVRRLVKNGEFVVCPHCDSPCYTGPACPGCAVPPR